jgi:glycosyltransferase involved in cell wall biosynthesis
MEVLFESTVALLRERGHEVATLERDNAGIRGLAAKARAAMDGVYSPGASREMTALLRRERVDVVHLHNLYPLLSPSVVNACRAAGVPVVMTLSDYKLICPTGQYFRDGAPCHRCAGGREYRCVSSNCRGNLAESVAYALRTAAARRGGWVTRGVDRFLACSDFLRERFVAEGFPADRVVVLPNPARMPAEAPRPGDGEYAAFVGRISPEKGLDCLVAAARIAGIPVRVAGDPARMPHLAAAAPPNVCFVGALRRDELGDFLAGARFLVVPSTFEEPFGIVAAEAMGHARAVVAARSGGLAEVVDDGETGFLFAPGDDGALAVLMRRLWDDPALAERLGRAGRVKAWREYRGEIYCTRLERIYQEVTRPAGSMTATPAATA